MGNYVVTAKKADFVLVDEGTYRVKLVSLEDGPEGQYGPSIRWNFEITEEGDDWDGQKLTGMTSTKIGIVPDKESKAYLWFRALSGETLEDGDEIDLESELIGKSAVATVIHKTSGKGNTFANVSALSPDRKRRNGNGNGSAPTPARQPQPTRRRQADEGEGEGIPF